jgi:hypothetical protein
VLDAISGSFVTLEAGAYEGVDTHVMDAFTTRAYLVVLKYAQQTLYVSLENVEAKTPEEAVALALERSYKYGKKVAKLGNLMSSECLVDTQAERDRLKLGHELDAEIQYLEMYPDNTNPAYWEPDYEYVSHDERNVKGRPDYWDDAGD